MEAVFLCYRSFKTDLRTNRNPPLEPFPLIFSFNHLDDEDLGAFERNFVLRLFAATQLFVKILKKELSSGPIRKLSGVKEVNTWLSGCLGTAICLSSSQYFIRDLLHRDLFHCLPKESFRSYQHCWTNKNHLEAGFLIMLPL